MVFWVSAAAVCQIFSAFLMLIVLLYHNVIFTGRPLNLLKQSHVGNFSFMDPVSFDTDY